MKRENINFLKYETPYFEDMIMRTSGAADCTGPGDYLSWADMEWSVSGDVTSGVVDTEELCHR